MKAIYVFSLLCCWLQLLQLPVRAGVAATPAETEAPPLPRQPIICPNNETSRETLMEARVEAIRQEILLKLNLEAPPPDPTSYDMEEAAALASYRAALQTTNQHNAINERSGVTPQECDGGGRGSSFFAQQRRLYFPSSFSADTPLVEMFEWGDLLKRNKRKALVNDKPDSNHSDDSGKNENKATEQPILTPAPTQLPKYPTLNGKPLNEYLSPLVYRVVFSNVDTVPSSLLSSAVLNLYKRKKNYDSPQIKLDSNPLETIEIYRVLQTTNRNGNIISHSIRIGSTLLSTESDGYEQFDVTEVVRDWMQMASEDLLSDLELEVVIRTAESIETGRVFLPSIEFDVPGVTEKGEKDAQLVISIFREEEQQRLSDTGSGTPLRRKRNSHNGIKKEHCFNNPDEQNCCVRELEINFHQDLGFNWVLAPDSFQTNYCQGLCPYYWPSATQSTSFLMQLRQTNPTAAPEPCCVANSVKPLTLLMVINGRILLNELPDMTVESCICR